LFLSRPTTTSSPPPPPPPTHRISEVEEKYYADGEDAYAMKRNLDAFKVKDEDAN
jgi:hypothetical protein